MFFVFASQDHFVMHRKKRPRRSFATRHCEVDMFRWQLPPPSSADGATGCVNDDSHVQHHTRYGIVRNQDVDLPSVSTQTANMI